MSRIFGEKNNLRGITWKVGKGERPLLSGTHCLFVIHIPIKLHEDIKNSTERVMVLVWFVALSRSQSTAAMVMLGWSVHLTEIFSWASWAKWLTSTSCTYFRL